MSRANRSTSSICDDQAYSSDPNDGTTSRNGAVNNGDSQAGVTNPNSRGLSTNSSVIRNLLLPTTQETRDLGVNALANSQAGNAYGLVNENEVQDIPFASFFLPEMTAKDRLELGLDDPPTINRLRNTPYQPNQTPIAESSGSSEFHLSPPDTVHARTLQDNAFGNNQTAVSEPSVLLSEIWSYSRGGFDVFNNVPTQTSTTAATDDLAHASSLSVVENGNIQPPPSNMLAAHTSFSQDSNEHGQANLEDPVEGRSFSPLIEDEDSDHGIDGNASNHNGQPSGDIPDSSRGGRPARLSDYLSEVDPETRAQWQDAWNTIRGTERTDGQRGRTLESPETTSRQSAASPTRNAGDVDRNRRASRNVVPSFRRT